MTPRRWPGCVWTAAVVGALAVSAAHPAATLPSVSDVVSTLQAAASYFLATLNGVPGSCGWTRGAYFTGHMALYNLTGNATLLSWAQQWGVSNDWACANSTNANDECCGQTYVDVWRASPSPDKLNLQYTLRLQVEQPTSQDWTWIDAVFMAMPTFARFGAVLDNPAYWDKMYAEWRYTAYQIAGPGLWDPQFSLFFRDPTYINATTPSGTKVFWGRGNGWAMAALARTLAALPANHPQRPEYMGKLVAMAAALQPLQGTDGFWRSSLIDPGQFPNPETTSTALITYAIAWAVNHAVLPASTYTPTVLRAWQGLSTIAFQPPGLVGWCQPTNDQPAPAYANSTSDFCVGQFLLAGSETASLLQHLRQA